MITLLSCLFYFQPRFCLHCIYQLNELFLVFLSCLGVYVLDYAFAVDSRCEPSSVKITETEAGEEVAKRVVDKDRIIRNSLPMLHTLVLPALLFLQKTVFHPMMFFKYRLYRLPHTPITYSFNNVQGNL